MAAAASGFLAASFVPFAKYQELADWLAGRRQKQFTPEFYLALLAVLWIAAAGLAIAAFAAARWRARMARHLAEISAAFAHEVALALRTGRALLAEPGRIAFGIALAAGVTLRALYSNQPMRYDECYTYFDYVRPGIVRGLALGYYPNNHLLHTILIWMSTSLFGSSPIAIRIPSLLAGVGLIAAVYFYAAALRWETGAIGVALIATNAYLILLADTSRGYSLAALFFFLLLPAARILGQQPRRSGLWAAFVILSVLSLWTVPTSAMAIAGAVAIVLFERAGSRRLSRRKFSGLAGALGATAVITAVLYLPPLLGSGPAAIFKNRFVQPVPWYQLPHEAADGFATLWARWHAGWPPVFLVAVWIAFAVGLIARGRASWDFLLVSAASIAVVLAQRVAPPPRALLFLLPLYLLVAAEGLVRILDFLRTSRRYQAAAAAIIAIAGSVVVLRSHAVLELPEGGRNVDPAEVAQVIKSEFKPGDAVIATVGASMPVYYHLTRHGANLDRWQNPNPARLFVILDKIPGQPFAGHGITEEIADAFTEYHMTGQQARFSAMRTLFDSRHARVILFERGRRRD